MKPKETRGRKTILELPKKGKVKQYPKAQAGTIRHLAWGRDIKIQTWTEGEFIFVKGL